jgi:hypothetical protein
MKLTDLIEMCERRLLQLGNRRTSAVELGDMRQIQDIDAEAEDTQTTLNQLRTLLA